MQEGAGLAEGPRHRRDVDRHRRETAVARRTERAQKLAGVPVKKLFNVAGQSYRDGDFKAKVPNMTDAQAFTALAKDGKLIKRPLLVGDGFALVGFDESAWRQALV